MFSSDIFSLFSLSRIVATSLGILVFRVCYQIVHYRYFHPLSSFPGPFWASVTRLWGAYHDFKGDEYEVELEELKKHGPVIRISPTLLLVNDYTKIPDIYHRYAYKSPYYLASSFSKTDSTFNMQDWREHATTRKLIAGPYSFTNVKKMEPLIDTRLRQWIGKIDEQFAKTGKQFDFAPWAVFLAYDIISEFGFGAPFGFIESGTDVGGLIKGFHDGLILFGLSARLYPFTNWLKSTWVGERYLVASMEDNSGMGMLMRFRDKLLAERQREIEAGEAGDRVDILQRLLEARTDDGKPIDMDRIKAETLLVMLAGADTTGTAFNALVCNIMSNPRVYQSLMTEIDNVTRAGLLSPLPQYDEVRQHCPYYGACLEETLRLWPPSPLILPRLVSKGGMFLGGKFVPEGMEVASSAWLLGREEKLYGKDVEIFRPERWLENETLKKDHSYSAVFGHGTRTCAGKDIALMELHKNPVQFFRTFQLKLANEKQPGTREVRGGVSFFKDIWTTIERRPGVHLV